MDQLVTKGKSENLAFQEVKARRVMLDPRALQACLAHLVLKDKQAEMGLMVLRVLLEILVLQANLESQDHLDLVVKMVIQVPMEVKDSRVLLDQKDSQVLKENQVNWVIQAHRDHQVHRDHQDLRVIQAQLEKMDNMVNKDHLEQQVIQVHQELVEHQVLRVIQDSQGVMELME